MAHPEWTTNLPEVVTASIVTLVNYLRIMELNQVIITDYGEVTFSHVTQAISKEIRVAI